jgi:hypothetical protein
MRSAQHERINLLESYRKAGRNDYFELGFVDCLAAKNTVEYSAYVEAFNEAKKREIDNEQ